MKKVELVEAVAEKTGLTKADATRAIDATFDAITEALKKGEKTTLVGFGTFGVSERAARSGRNPQTGAPCYNRCSYSCYIQSRSCFKRSC